MTAPRLQIRLDHLRHNARTLVDRLAPRGIRVTGVTKATMGSPQVARALLAGGVTGLGESRIENVETLRHGGIDAPITLIRTPMLSQVDRVVRAADTSLNTDLGVIGALDAAARGCGRRHRVILMVELGDLREGIMPCDLAHTVHEVLRLEHVDLVGIGANLACQHGVRPDPTNMAELSALADALEARTGVPLDVISGGNSASVAWATTHDPGRVNELRLGEAILLGLDPSDRSPIDGLRLDACTLAAEVIESSVKPGRPWGERGETAFGPGTDMPADVDDAPRSILALGRQDVDPDGIVAPPGTRILGSSSDHLILGTTGAAVPEVGSEVTFAVTGYSALLRAMTSPHVSTVYLDP